ncbi:uncharacterized protein [Pseudorasbora parva]|uniref:uncharacterized protein n=1 Tax=Pseudorasbora parva TaxID=51549 RepID=UPI00351F2A28
MIETLNELAHLRDAWFGRPWPRHGLKLLYWFANDCFSFGNGNIMLSECDPANRDFGFHYFENRYDDDGDKLLPDIDLPYYVVGNLNSPGAEELPDYVSEDKSPDQHNSNTDRIIVSLYDEECFHRVYVTQHHDRLNYDPNGTYRISRGLLMIIRRRCLKDFLEEMGYYTSIQPFLPTPVFIYRPRTTNTVRPDFTVIAPSSSDSDDSEPPETQRNHTNIQRDDNKKTGYHIPPILPTPVISYTPQTTGMLSRDFVLVTPSPSDPEDSEPPETQRNHTNIQKDDNKKTGYNTYIQPFLPTPFINYRPQTTNTVSPELTVVTPSSSDPAHNESPAKQNSETKIQIDDDTSTLNHSENLSKKKGLCKRCCTIL